MPTPEFTDEEQYLISYTKSTETKVPFNPMTWGCLVSSSLLAGIGVYQQDATMVLCGFIVLCVFRVFEEFTNHQWIPTWQSIIAKYEAASEPDSK